MTNTMPKTYVELILDDEKLTQAEKIQRINYVYNNYQEKLDEDLRNYLIKIWSGGLLEIASAAIPFGGAGKLGAAAGQKLLQKSIGRKLSQEIGAGAASGLTSGAVFGAGRGLIEDKNPLLTGLQDAAGGLAAGGLVGGAGGYLEKAVRAKQLENSKPLSELTQAQIKNLMKQGKDYYQDYLRDTYVPYPLLDKIYFHNSQAKEIRPHNMKMIPRLPEQIRSAQGLRYSNDKPWREDANNFYKLYNTHKGKTYEYVIRNKANKTGNDFYQIKEVDPGSAYLHHNQALEPEPNNIINYNSKNINPVQADELKNLQKLNKSAAKRLTVSAPTSNLSPEKGRNSISRLAANKAIINDNSEKVNPVKMIVPAQIQQGLQETNQPSSLLEGSVEMNVDQNGNQIFIPQEIGAGAASGLASGAVFGAGRGLIEDKNPLMTGLQDLTSGLLLGGSMGAIGGNLNRIFAGNTLKQYQLNNITPADYKKYKQQAQNFYKDYLQGRTIVNKDIGSIDITRKGLDEIFSKNVELAQLFPDLINDLRKADYVETNALYKVRKDKATEKFHILKNGENKHFIAEDKLGNKKFYLTKKYTTDQGTPSRVEGTSSGGAFIHNGTPQASSPGSKVDILKDTHKSGSHATSTDALVSPYNIINDNPEKVNPVKTIVPAQILQGLQEANQPSFLLDGSVEMNVDQNGNQIFTPQEIGEMTSDEFYKNLPIIEQQLKDGLIKPQAHQVDYSGYVNPVTGDGKIFSREAISQMRGDEYTGNESAIMAQLKSIGIPYDSDLELASMRGGLVYVRPYTREDGTEVRGYWRSAPTR